jgi:hypothetical protein
METELVSSESSNVGKSTAPASRVASSLPSPSWSLPSVKSEASSSHCAMDNGSDSAASSTIYDINSDNNDIGIKIRAKKEEEEVYNNHDNKIDKNGTDDYDLNRGRTTAMVMMTKRVKPKQPQKVVTTIIMMTGRMEIGVGCYLLRIIMIMLTLMTRLDRVKALIVQLIPRSKQKMVIQRIIPVVTSPESP